MIPVREIADSVVAIISDNMFIKFVFKLHKHKLCKLNLSSIHGDYMYDRYHYEIKISNC